MVIRTFNYITQPAHVTSRHCPQLYGIPITPGALCHTLMDPGEGRQGGAERPTKATQPAKQPAGTWHQGFPFKPGLDCLHPHVLETRGRRPTSGAG